METLNNIINATNAFLWGPPMLILLFGTHVFYTIRLCFIQKYIRKAFSVVIERDAIKSGNVSPFAALAVALASTIGTGNIIGVATAISLGGPGAVFWCMLTGIFGMSTKYAESLLAVKYRVKDENGEVHGGPMYTILRGVGWRWMAIFFSVAAAIAVLGTGNLVQSNAISSVITKTFAVPGWISGLILAILTGLVIMGGLQSIAKVCTAMVPVMAFVYLLGCASLLIINRAVLGDTLLLIVKSAFSAKAAAGGVVGYGLMLAARYGIARGLFSNEAGMGSEPIVAATARTRNAVRQGLVSYSGTFCTIIICALTGLVIISSVIASQGTELPIDITDDMLSQACFERIPFCGQYILSFAIFAFATTTLLGWFYYGEQCVRFIFPNRGSVTAYKIIYVIVTFFGAVASLPIVWKLADLANGIMVLPNILSVLILHKVVVSETRRLLWSGKVDEIDPDI